MWLEYRYHGDRTKCLLRRLIGVAVLIVLLATVGSWVSSDFTATGAHCERYGLGYFDLWSRDGGVEFNWTFTKEDLVDQWRSDLSYPSAWLDNHTDAKQHRIAGFVFESFNSSGTNAFLRIPYWFIVSLQLALIAC
jgi:hypothetical protein